MGYNGLGGLVHLDVPGVSVFSRMAFTMKDCEHELGPPKIKKFKWGLCLMWYCKKCEHGWGTKTEITSTPNQPAYGGLWDSKEEEG